MKRKAIIVLEGFGLYFLYVLAILALFLGGIRIGMIVEQIIN